MEKYRSVSAKQDRNEEIYSLREKGLTFREIAEKYEISNNRAYQIFNDVKKRIIWAEIKEKAK